MLVFWHWGMGSRLSHPLQVVVFDLEFGQPAASTSLPSSRPPFRNILGCFGHQAVGKDVSLGGIDLLYCSHQVSNWQLHW